VQILLYHFTKPMAATREPLDTGLVNIGNLSSWIDVERVCGRHDSRYIQILVRHFSSPV
jgi:hypothetical protein